LYVNIFAVAMKERKAFQQPQKCRWSVAWPPLGDPATLNHKLPLGGKVYTTLLVEHTQYNSFLKIYFRCY